MSALREKLPEAQKWLTLRPTMSGDAIANEICKSDPSINPTSLGRKIRLWLQKGELKRGVTHEAKVLLFDIETLPLLSYTWGKWDQNIGDSQIVKDWCIVCWSAKWLFKEEIYSACLNPQEAIDRHDKRITESLWAMFNEADVIIAHNLDKFDEKRSNTRFIKHGLGKPSPYKKVDTLKVMRRKFACTSNRLDYAAKFFDLPAVGKMRTDFELWKKCDEGDNEALQYMQKYCNHDIQLLEDLYLTVRNWVDNHPNIGLILGQEITVCPTCGSKDLTIDGTPYYTSVNEYTSLLCGSCGSRSRSRKTATPDKVRASLIR
jgi:DNA polymerase elongation subunit (family B)